MVLIYLDIFLYVPKLQFKITVFLAHFIFQLKSIEIPFKNKQYNLI